MPLEQQYWQGPTYLLQYTKTWAARRVRRHAMLHKSYIPSDLAEDVSATLCLPHLPTML